MILQCYARNIYGESIKITILRNMYRLRKYSVSEENLFLLLSGKAGKKFIEEVFRLMNEWLLDLPLKDIAFEAIMVMRNLLLQKPSQKSKSKDHVST